MKFLLAAPVLFVSMCLVKDVLTKPAASSSKAQKTQVSTAQPEIQSYSVDGYSSALCPDSNRFCPPSPCGPSNCGPCGPSAPGWCPPNPCSPCGPSNCGPCGPSGTSPNLNAFLYNIWIAIVTARTPEQRRIVRQRLLALIAQAHVLLRCQSSCNTSWYDQYAVQYRRPIPLSLLFAYLSSLARQLSYSNQECLINGSGRGPLY